MLIVCPSCRYERDIPEDRIPQGADTATCPRCHHRFRFRVKPEPPGDAPAVERETPAPLPPLAEPEKPRPEEDIWHRLEQLQPPPDADGSSLRKDEPDTGQEAGNDPLFTDSKEDADDGAPPWERLDRYGFFHGLALTVKRVLFSSPRFFRAMPLRRGFIKPLIFYLLITELQAVGQFLWHQAAASVPADAMQSSSLGQAMGLGSLSAGAMLLATPALFAAALFASAFFNHFFLMVFRAASGGFEGTFRALAYGNTPILLGVIPVVGPLVAWTWSLVLIVIGYKVVHRTTFSRVTLALCLPAVLMSLLVLLFA